MKEEDSLILVLCIVKSSNLDNSICILFVLELEVFVLVSGQEKLIKPLSIQSPPCIWSCMLFLCFNVPVIVEIESACKKIRRNLIL